MAQNRSEQFVGNEIDSIYRETSTDEDFFCCSKVLKVEMAAGETVQSAPAFIQDSLPGRQFEKAPTSTEVSTVNGRSFDTVTITLDLNPVVKNEIVESSDLSSAQDPLNFVKCEIYSDEDKSYNQNYEFDCASEEEKVEVPSTAICSSKSPIKCEDLTPSSVVYIPESPNKSPSIKPLEARVGRHIPVCPMKHLNQNAEKANQQFSKSLVKCTVLSSHDEEGRIKYDFLESPERKAKHPSETLSSLAEKPWKCKICYRRYSFICCLEAHKAAVHAADKLFACEFCDKKFGRKYDRDHHRNVHTGDRKFSCPICNKAFKQRSTLAVHVSIHSTDLKFKCEICGKAFALNLKLKAHMRTHSEKNYKCDLCDKSFNLLGALKSHLMTHSGDKRFCCDVCGKTFLSNTQLKEHLPLHGEKTFKCHLCDKSFHRKLGLRRHIITHTGEKNYKCKFCDKKFSFLTNMRVHMFLHTGEKRYKCNICDREFTHGSNFNKHQLVHSGIKKYVCDVCGKRFSQKNSLKIHIAIHSRTKSKVQ